MRPIVADPRVTPLPKTMVGTRTNFVTLRTPKNGTLRTGDVNLRRELRWISDTSHGGEIPKR